MSLRQGLQRWHQRWHQAHPHWRRAGHGLQRRMRHSIKARLVLLFLLLGLATAAVFLVGLQRGLQDGWQAFARPLLTDYVDRLAAEIGSPPDLQRAQALTQRLPIRVRIEGPQLHYDSQPPAARNDAGAWGNGGRERGFDAEAWGLVRTTADGHRLQFSLALANERWHRRGFAWITLGTLAVLTLLAYAAVRRLLRPLEDITVAVERYGRGDLGQPIAVRRHDELGDLAERINRMAGSLHGMLEAKRALLLAISHELRSPLTRARLHAELLDDSRERHALLRDLAEMGELITSLLESERLGEGHRALQCEATDLAALADDVLRQGFADMPLTQALAPDLGPVQVDPMRLRLLLRNLLENARRHAADAAAPPELFARREPDGRLALGVRDHGPGVSAEHLARLGEAFFRPDSARTRAGGGVGLGLHLCRLVAQAHGGELRIRAAQPGLEVAMVWPGR